MRIGLEPCMCGHSVEEHGNDPKYPGSIACTGKGCDCIAYEADEGDGPFTTDEVE